MKDDLTHREKEVFIERLFSSIAPKYDLLNWVLSLSRHKAWWRFAASNSGLKPGGCALDVCCGTGDFAFELMGIVGSAECFRAAGLRDVSFYDLMFGAVCVHAARSRFDRVDKVDRVNRVLARIIHEQID